LRLPVPPVVPEMEETPRWRTTAGAVLWGLFGVLTLIAAINQMAFAEDGAGWLLLTFLYVFAALMIWESVGLWRKLWTADRKARGLGGLPGARGNLEVLPRADAGVACPDD
jgi:hypothetical protein